MSISKYIFPLDILTDWLSAVKWLWLWQMTDPSSRQRESSTETRQQIPDLNTWKGSNIWSNVHKVGSTPRHTDWLTVSRQVTLTRSLQSHCLVTTVAQLIRGRYPATNVNIILYCEGPCFMSRKFTLLHRSRVALLFKECHSRGITYGRYVSPSARRTALICQQLRRARDSTTATKRTASCYIYLASCHSALLV
jgi:hypothetical protein